MRHDAPVNLVTRQQQILSHWSPEHILTINKSHSFKLATFKGEFIWHTHPETDEIFYVVSGGPLNIEIATNAETKHENDGFETVVLRIGDMFKVPQGYRHRPITENATGVLLVEKIGTINTGDEKDSDAGKARTKHVEEKVT